MNNSNAAAKARRAGIKPTTPSMPTPGQQTNGQTGGQSNSTAGLTLPQVISVIDRRLVTLETFMKETKESPVAPATMNSEDADEAGVIVPSEFNSFVDEINNRFQLLAEELETMKNALLKLQTYTMDVNTVLLAKTNTPVPDSVADAIVQLPTADEAVSSDVESSEEKEDLDEST
jgi:hypothetical protein